MDNGKRPGQFIWTTTQVANHLGISDRHVRRLADEGVFLVVGEYSDGRNGRPIKLFNVNQVTSAWATYHKRRKAVT